MSGGGSWLTVARAASSFCPLPIDVPGQKDCAMVCGSVPRAKVVAGGVKEEECI